jgi:hypothetical protein
MELPAVDVLLQQLREADLQPERPRRVAAGTGLRAAAPIR